MATDVEVPVVPEIEIEAPTEEINVEAALTEAAEVVAPTPVVPEKYDLKVKDGVTVDPALLERTAAKARTLGLSQEKGQQLLDVELEERAATEKTWKAEEAAFIKSWEPGGAAYEKQKSEWIAEAMKSKAVVGNNPTPDGFKVVADKVQQVLTAYATPKLTALLQKEGFLYHPEVLGFLMNLSRKTSEGRLVLGGTPNSGQPKTAAEILYPNDVKQSA